MRNWPQNRIRHARVLLGDLPLKERDRGGRSGQGATWIMTQGCHLWQRERRKDGLERASGCSVVLRCFPKTLYFYILSKPTLTPIATSGCKGDWEVPPLFCAIACLGINVSAVPMEEEENRQGVGTPSHVYPRAHFLEPNWPLETIP